MTPLPGLTSCILAMTQHAPSGSTLPLYAVQCIARHALQMLASGSEGQSQVRSLLCSAATLHACMKQLQGLSCVRVELIARQLFLRIAGIWWPSLAWSQGSSCLLGRCKDIKLKSHGRVHTHS